MTQSYHVWPLGSGCFHSAQWGEVYPCGSCTPLYECDEHCLLYTRQSVGIWIVGLFYFKQSLLWTLQVSSLCVDMVSSLSHKCLGVELLGHMVHLCLPFRTMQTVVSPFYILTNDVGDSYFCISLVTFALQYSFEIRKYKSPTLFSVFQAIALLMGAKWYLKGFHLHFPNICEAYLHVLIGHSCILVKCLFKSAAYF